MEGKHALTKPAEECAEEGKHQWQLQPCGPMPAYDFCWMPHENLPENISDCAQAPDTSSALMARSGTPPLTG